LSNMKKYIEQQMTYIAILVDWKINLLATKLVMDAVAVVHTVVDCAMVQENIHIWMNDITQ